MNRLAALASAAALLLTGCGGSPRTSTSATRTAPQPTPTLQVSRGLSASPDAGLVVDQQGTTPARTLWSLRVEDTTAKPIVEQIFHDGRIALSRSIPAGSYRVIVWSRPCAGTCPTTGEAGLGQLQEVCGAQVTLSAGQRTSSTAVLAKDGSCTIRLTR